MNSDLKTYSHIFKQEGTAQQERYLPALRPEHIAIDDRQLQDLILYAQRFSRNLLFVDAENNSAESTPSWEAFYQGDPVLLLSGIAARNVQEIRSVYDFLDQSFRKERTVENFVPVVKYTLSRYARLNQWYKASATDSSLRQDLQLYIRSYLSKKLTDLRQIIFHVNGFSRDPAMVVDFPLEEYPTEVWGDLNVEDQAFGQRVFIGDNDEDKLSHASLLLHDIFDAAFHVMENTITSGRDYLEETIRTTQNHPPHIALLIAFLELYGYLQKDLNKLPQRHLSYYYEQVLRIKVREAVPDQVFVVFELVKGFTRYQIEKGVALSAGKDRQNKELVYKIDRELVLYPARVTALQTLSIVRDRQNRIAGYYTDTLLKNSEKVLEEAFGRIFGSNRTAATVGLAISSTQLYLARGVRNVTVSFQSAEEIPIPEFDPGLLKLLLTGEKGWLGNDAKDMVLIHSLTRTSTHTLDLRFTISIAQPSAIVAFDEAIHEGNFTTKAPVMQVLLNYPSVHPEAAPQEKIDYESKIAQLHFLQGMRVVDTRIGVEVGDVQAPVSFDGVRDLLLQNHESMLDGQKPFYPFSPLPKVGSSFYIGCKDLFYKDIDQLSLSLEWMLPDHFGKHYANYLPPYNAHSFRAGLSLLNGKRWGKIADVSIIDALAAEPQFCSIQINADQIRQAREEASQETGVGKFDVHKPDGTLKLKLNYPDFGHSIYPQLLTSSVMKMNSSQGDYLSKIKKELHDSMISIKVPERINKSPNSKRLLDLITEILTNVKEDVRAKGMLIKSLGPIIQAHNDVTALAGNRLSGDIRKSAGTEGGTVIVNDDNFIERRIFSLLRKLNLIGQTEHFDKDKDTVQDVVENLEDTIRDELDEEEIVKLILDETRQAIHQTVVKLADKLIFFRKPGGIPDPAGIQIIMDAEFAEANQDINDSLAKKIATALLLDEMPPPPYTPLINSISLSYQSSKRCVAGEDQFFQITPFGVIEISPFAENTPSSTTGKVDRVNTTRLFPNAFVTADTTNQQSPVSFFFLGIQNLVAHQTLSLLFQFAEGSRKIDKAPPPVSWWYLSNGQWVPFAADRLVSDTTYGLQTTGILQIAVPLDATNHPIVFGESDLYWLCASIEKDKDAFPGLIRVAANATTATFENQDNDPAHLALPLPANKITRLLEMNPAIKKVEQPVASIRGRVKERDQEYFTRVSERLRHKAKAISNWDYERLVLEHFPTVYKVKCLNNYYAGTSVAGHVTIVPICDLRNRSYFGADMLLPKASDITLKNIEKLLSSKSSPFVKIHAINPQLDQVLISCKVRFYKGLEQGFYLQKLNEDLINYLTPWATKEQESVSFSAKVYASSVINFIDNRPYVDYVIDLSMNQYTEDEQGNQLFCRTDSQSISLVETQFTTGHAVLVSAPRHRIDLVE